MGRLIVPLVIVGAGQWLAIAWWRVVDGLEFSLSFGTMFRELLGLEPRLAWEPAERLLSGLLGVSPGTACLVLAGYLILRQAVVRFAGSHARSRFVAKVLG